MPTLHELSIADRIRHHALRLDGGAHDYDALLAMVGQARFVLLGEASHGTAEFYRERARITRRLIEEHRFTAVAVEADWPDAWRVNRYVRGMGGDTSVAAALDGFRRFPTWMWRNTDVVDFLRWLRAWNERHPVGAGFYGLDLYSLYTSIDEVLHYLRRVDPEAAQQARQRYACFDHYHADSQQYGYAASLGISASCERAVVEQLRALQARAADYARHGGQDAFFTAQQNARLVMNAEQYYRGMFQRRVSSWNLRDRHMADTLAELDGHLAQATGAPPRIVVWEHNSHIGDARATEVAEQGEWNVGQLVRERWGREQVRLIGFSTYHGWVTAASGWDEPAERKRVNPALPHSYENLFHQTGLERFYLDLRTPNRATEALREGRLQRAIGVVYLPRTERHSHYFHTRITDQFDAIIHLDDTTAVVPLDDGAGAGGEAPETYPSGL
jgi:erythromycin esterase-like protein